MNARTLVCLLGLAAGLCAQSQATGSLVHVPPGATPTHVIPGTSTATPQTIFTMGTGVTDPSGAEPEYGVACAQNGWLFVEIPQPAHSTDDLTGVTPVTWFFDDPQPPQLVWRGAVVHENFVYGCVGTLPTVARFEVDYAAPAGSAGRVVRHSSFGQGDLAFVGHRLEVDEEREHLHVLSFDGMNNFRPSLFIYDIAGQSAATTPTLLAVYSPGGLMFNSHVAGNRAYLSYQRPGNGSRNVYRIIDLEHFPPPGQPRAWNPAWIEWDHFPFGALSHDSYIAEDGFHWFTTTEAGPGTMTAFDLSKLADAPLPSQVMETPPIRGTYNVAPSAPWYPLHAIEGIGLTGYIAHWESGAHVIDLSKPSNIGGEYELLARFDQNSGTTLAIGQGVWHCHPHQDSGLIYTFDCQLGFDAVRVEQGHVGRYGVVDPDPPRIWLKRPPRVGGSMHLRVDGLTPGRPAQLLFGLAEDANYLSGCTPACSSFALPPTATTRLLIDPDPTQTFTFTVPSVGAVEAEFPFPAAPAMQGMKIFVQVVDDPGTPSTRVSRGTWFGIAKP